MYLRCGRFLCVFLLSSFVGSLYSQTSAPAAGNATTTIKSKVRLVLVDVVVTNGKGEAVTGLRQEDFEILEDGKPQSVSTFEEHHGALLTQITLPPMPPHVYTNFPVTRTADSVNVLLLDALNTPSKDQSYVHLQMLKSLKTIPPGTRVAIFTLASQLRMLQGVTTDSSELLAVLNSSKAQVQPSAVLPSEVESDADQHLIDFMQENSNAPLAQTPSPSGVDPISAMQQFLSDTAAFQTEARIAMSLDALQHLARYLASVPGRKNVIWFSGSFPFTIFPDSDLADPSRAVNSFQNEIRKTADLLTASQVAIYPVAAEGLAADSVYQVNGEEIGQMRPSMAVRAQVRQMRTAGTNRDLGHISMEEIARDTGGEAFYNGNGLDESLARVINTGSRYYSLSYSPTNSTMDGKYRRIQVKLLNGKDNLSYRRGYYADDLDAAPTVQKADSDPLLPLMGRNLPNYSQILYKIKVLPLNPQPAPDAPHIGSNTELKGPFTRYGVDFAISAEDLKLDPTLEGARHGSLEFALIAYDREGKPLNFVVSRGDLLVKPDGYASMRKVGLQIHKEIDVPKEYVYLRSGVYDFMSGCAGTLGIPLADVAQPAAK